MVRVATSFVLSLLCIHSCTYLRARHIQRMAAFDETVLPPARKPVDPSICIAGLPESGKSTLYDLISSEWRCCTTDLTQIPVCDVAVIMVDPITLKKPDL